MAGARLWRLYRSIRSGADSASSRCAGAVLEQNALGYRQNAGLGGLDLRRFFATTKKGAVTPKPKTKKGPQTTKGKKGTHAAKGASGSEGGGGGGSGTIEDFTIREPAELLEDNLFMGARGVNEITPDDINKYFHISEEAVAKYFPEGLPKGMVKEFEMSRSRFVRVRSSTLELLNRLQFSATGAFAFFHPAVMPDHYPAKPRTAAEADPEAQPESPEEIQPKTEVSEPKVDDPEASPEGIQPKTEVSKPNVDPKAQQESPETKTGVSKRKVDYRALRKADRDLRKERAMERYKHLILDGPVGCGKSFTLGVIVQWARLRGWLVFYVPRAKEWTRGGYYYHNELTGFWDTPLQAQSVLQGFLDSHGEMLEQIKCRVPDPIVLGEAAALGRLPGPQEISLPEGASLKDLVEKGISVQAAASNIVVRLRQELDLVKEFPVLIAVDEYNSWFTFSEFNQFLDFRKTRRIHARELGMVNAFRKMDNSPQNFIGAFSQSTVVGKLPLELPGAPKKYRIDVAKLNKTETDVAIKYYQRLNLLHNDPQEDSINRLFFLTNGNGAELRKLVRYI